MKEKKQAGIGSAQWVSCAAIFCIWLALGAFCPDVLRRLIEAYRTLVQQLPVLELSHIKRIVAAAAAYFAAPVC